MKELNKEKKSDEKIYQNIIQKEG